MRLQKDIRLMLFENEDEGLSIFWSVFQHIMLISNLKQMFMFYVYVVCIWRETKQTLNLQL